MISSEGLYSTENRDITVQDRNGSQQCSLKLETKRKVSLKLADFAELCAGTAALHDIHMLTFSRPRLYMEGLVRNFAV